MFNVQGMVVMRFEVWLAGQKQIQKKPNTEDTHSDIKRKLHLPPWHVAHLLVHFLSTTFMTTRATAGPLCQRHCQPSPLEKRWGRDLNWNGRNLKVSPWDELTYRRVQTSINEDNNPHSWSLAECLMILYDCIYELYGVPEPWVIGEGGGRWSPLLSAR